MNCNIDADKITTHVYQGSRPPRGEVVKRCGFDVLVLTAMELQFPKELFPGVTVLHVPLDDAELTNREWDAAVQTAERVARMVRGGKRALITCAQGRNRSGLVTALTVHMLTGESGKKIVKHIQNRRMNALTNTSFVQALSRLPKRF